MNILKRIRWGHVIVYLLMFASCLVVWYFVICQLIKLIKMALGLT